MSEIESGEVSGLAEEEAAVEETVEVEPEVEQPEVEAVAEAAPEVEVPTGELTADDKAKMDQINSLHAYQDLHREAAEQSIKALKDVACRGENIFEELLNACRYCSLGQISHALYEVGGEYRRNM